LVEGKTVHYIKDGKHYGSERFYGKGRATWQFPGATCDDGVYWAVEDELCFQYGTPSCWSVLEGADEKRTASSIVDTTRHIAEAYAMDWFRSVRHRRRED